MTPTYDVVYVVWHDADATGEWTSLDELSDEVETTHSVGFLVRETEALLILALTYDNSTSSINAYMSIPRSCILEQRVLCSLTMT